MSLRKGIDQLIPLLLCLVIVELYRSFAAEAYGAQCDVLSREGAVEIDRKAALQALEDRASGHRRSNTASGGGPAAASMSTASAASMGQSADSAEGDAAGAAVAEVWGAFDGELYRQPALDTAPLKPLRPAFRCEAEKAARRAYAVGLSAGSASAGSASPFPRSGGSGGAERAWQAAAAGNSGGGGDNSDSDADDDNFVGIGGGGGGGGGDGGGGGVGNNDEEYARRFLSLDQPAAVDRAAVQVTTQTPMLAQPPGSSDI